MAVYTKINNRDVLSLSKKFNIGKVIKFNGIKQGIENTNYLLQNKNNKYILTIFEKRVQKKDLPFFMKLMDGLYQRKINCPRPLKDKNGKYLFSLKKKSACIVTFLKGKDKKILNNINCYDTGKSIAKLHLASKKIELYRKNSMSIDNLDLLLKSIKFKSKSILPNLQIILSGEEFKTLFFTSKFFSNSLPPKIEINSNLEKLFLYSFALSMAPLAA